MNPISNLSDFVMVEGSQPVTDSRRVAKHYGKRHADVLRSISAMLESKVQEIARFAERNFALSFEINELANGRRDKYYTMTKDGFLELAMSFSGDAARLLRIRFVDAFNAMAAALRSGLWQRRMDAEAAYLAGKDQASVDGRGLSRWRREKIQHLGEIAELDRQMQIPLQLH